MSAKPKKRENNEGSIYHKESWVLVRINHNGKR